MTTPTEQKAEIETIIAVMDAMISSMDRSAHEYAVKQAPERIKALMEQQFTLQGQINEMNEMVAAIDEEMNETPRTDIAARRELAQERNKYAASRAVMNAKMTTITKSIASQQRLVAR